MKNNIRLLLISFLFSVESRAQIPAQVNDPSKVALRNIVEFKNGDHYIDPSFSYAGTGFIIDMGSYKLAATAKHILWIAKNKRSPFVQINDQLKSWKMIAKSNDSVFATIDQMINEDSTEILEGPGSTIMERDAIFFTVKNISPSIRSLKPRFSPVKAGEKVFFISADYTDSAAKVYEGRILRKPGTDILIERDMTTYRPGASGSPVVDPNGMLIGISSSGSSDGRTGKGVVVAVSMEYLQDVLAKKQPLNKPKEDYGAIVFKIGKDQGSKKAIQFYEKLTSDPQNYYRYNLRDAGRNGLREAGEMLMEIKKYSDAIELLQFNIKEYGSYYVNYNLLAKAYLLKGDTTSAIKTYGASTEKFSDANENEAFAELKRLETAGKK
ncbi:trypsin-like peptidase domain-containing protein [Pollutibacter soli]|uniref:trypsin-like peptidase domain-containing protein n=1 Tax=Pollutibacter soli TaxID=3034157 RepID=UPI0030133FFC